jgi:hypothetical protein
LGLGGGSVEVIDLFAKKNRRNKLLLYLILHISKFEDFPPVYDMMFMMIVKVGICWLAEDSSSVVHYTLL